MSRIGPSVVVLGFLAVLSGLLGAFYVRRTLQANTVPAPVADEESRTVIPVASTDLPAGRQVMFGDIAIMRLNRDQMKERGVTGPFMSNTEQIIGRVLNQNRVIIPLPCWITINVLSWDAGNVASHQS